MPLVRGLDGCWVLPGNVANAILPALRRAVDDARRVGAQIDPAILAELDAGEQAARLYRERQDVVDGVAGNVARREVRTLSLVKVADVAPFRSEVGTAEAAEILGVSRQAVTARCRRGTLLYRLDERGRYRFRKENLTRKGDHA